MGKLADWRRELDRVCEGLDEDDAMDAIDSLCRRFMDLNKPEVAWMILAVLDAYDGEGEKPKTPADDPVQIAYYDVRACAYRHMP